MASTSVTLNEEETTFLEGMVALGRFDDIAGGVHEALRLLREEDAGWDSFPEVDWETAKAGVLEGLEQIRRGEVVDGEEAFARILAKHFPK